MKTPVVLVAAALTLAILLAASFVIATGIRGENGKAVFGASQERLSSPAKSGDPAFRSVNG
jgi:hypothetical protein